MFCTLLLNQFATITDLITQIALRATWYETTLEKTCTQEFANPSRVLLVGFMTRIILDVTSIYNHDGKTSMLKYIYYWPEMNVLSMATLIIPRLNSNSFNSVKERVVDWNVRVPDTIPVQLTVATISFLWTSRPQPLSTIPLKLMDSV